MCVMKPRHNFASIVLPIFAFVCAIFISTIAEGGPPSGYLRSSHVPPGHLTVDRAANFGWNLGFNLQIDGRPVTTLAQGHSYSTSLSAGPHVLTVLQGAGCRLRRADFDNGQHSAWRGPSIRGRCGIQVWFISTRQEYWLTPGAHWQNRGNGVP